MTVRSAVDSRNPDEPETNEPDTDEHRSAARRTSKSGPWSTPPPRSEPPPPLEEADRATRLRSIPLAVLAGAVLGVAAVASLTQNSALPALFALPYVGFLALVWWGSRGNVAVLLVSAYLLAPPPADNLMPQVFIFGGDDLSLTPRDVALLADVVLAVVLLTLRPGLPKGRLARWYLGGLVLLAAYPVVVGLLGGAGQSVAALVQGMAMPLRGAGLLLVFMWWARTRGWGPTLRAVARGVVVAGVLLSAVELVFVLVSRGETAYSILGYAAVVDGRPSVPGWGNNILGNFLATGVAVVVFLGYRLNWWIRVRVLLACGLLLGLVLTELRTAMLLALAVSEGAVVLAAVRRVWPKRGPLLALLAGGGTGLGLIALTSTLLPVLNPRFLTFAPEPLRPFLSQFSVFGVDDSGNLVDDAGIDLGGRSVGTRRLLLETAIQVWRSSPLYGMGWNGWGWAKSDPSIVAEPQLVAVDPHNGLTWLLVDAGLLGLLLLYAVPVVIALRRWDLWWLWAVPACATALEMVNPNLRNAHFAIAFWAFIAIAMVAAPKPRPYGLRTWLRDAWDWVRGRPPRSGASLDEPDGVPARADAPDRDADGEPAQQPAGAGGGGP
jgi:hypothetical protein